MPRSRGTSRKGKPGKNERAAGMGQALQRAQQQRRIKSNKKRDGMLQVHEGIQSIGVEKKIDPVATGAKSVLEINDLDDFLQQAEMANREFVSEREGVVVLDSTGHQYRPSSVQWADQKQSSFVFTELSVPRRPTWDASTTPQQLQRSEEESFLDWRRAIAAKEEALLRQPSATLATVTPFEKNLQVWRQLWRVLERSDCLLQLADARNPLFYLSKDLKAYAQSLNKPMMVLLNKSDYLSRHQRQAWSDFLKGQGWDSVLFFSAVTEQKKLDDLARQQRQEEYARAKPTLAKETESNGQKQHEGLDRKVEESQEVVVSADGQGVDVPLTREQLLDAMLDFANKKGCHHDERNDSRMQFGMVGFPNVGKSSVINVLVSSSKHTHGTVRVGVASQPGKTKHFQTLYLPESSSNHHEKMMLCDCPGLVFPSFVSNTADLIAAGVYPIAQMRDHWPVMTLICQRIPLEILNVQYGINVPPENPATAHVPLAERFLETLCVARGMLAASSGVPDFTRASRMVIQDYATGKLLYCHAPPGLEPTQIDFSRETVDTCLNATRKLREKLERRQRLSTTELEGKVVQGEEDFDDNILALIADPPVDTGKDSKRSGRKRVGKKGRKHRNKDPYGCHSNPDDKMLNLGSGGGVGVVVKAGKYSQNGYTRPNTFTTIPPLSASASE